jgi:hypothetical protein
MYVQSILEYQLLANWPSLGKEQGQQLIRTVYKEARFILKAPQLLTAVFAVGKRTFFHRQNGTKYS